MKTEKKYVQKNGLGAKLGGDKNGRGSTRTDEAQIIGSNNQNDKTDIKMTNNSSGSLPVPDGKVITPSLKLFSLAELTRDFRPNTVLGEGGFRRVFGF